MALNETSKEFISLKKLQGKAHTSNNKGLANEAKSSGLTVSANTVFSTDIPASPTATLYAVTGGAVQYLRLSASFIPGSDTVAGRHAFELKLPDDYEAPTEDYISVHVLSVADDVSFMCVQGDKIIIDKKMLEEIRVEDSIYYLILENYVLGVIE